MCRLEGQAFFGAIGVSGSGSGASLHLQDLWSGVPLVLVPTSPNAFVREAKRSALEQQLTLIGVLVSHGIDSDPD